MMKVGLMSKYIVPSETYQTEIVIHKSRFISTISRVDSVDEAKAFLNSIRAQMPDASHHVYAFRIGHGKSVIEGMSDAGEPSGTSGPPILSILRGSDLGDVIIVVTRYFGGTKLGTGGLVRAYSEAAKAALDGVRTELKQDWITIRVQIEYSHFELIKRFIDGVDGHIIDIIYTDRVTLLIKFPADKVNSATEYITNTTAGQSNIEIIDEEIKE